MHSLIVDLQISADEYQRLYRGSARDVLTHARDGRRVRFPAKILVPYVSHHGVYGSFEIVFDAEHRFKTIRKI